MERERVEWLRRLVDAAGAASEDLRALDEPALHRALIQDLDAFRDRVAAELDAAAADGDQQEG